MYKALDQKFLEVKDFSGGITDYFIQGDTKRAEIIDNLYITPDRGLESRPGSIGYDSLGNHRISSPIRRIDGFLLFNNKSELLVNQGREVYYLDSTPAWTELEGPSGNSALSHGDSYNYVSWSESNAHLYLTSNAGSRPSKIYRDETNTLQVRTLGLPKPQMQLAYTDASLLQACITLANEIKTSMTNHMEDALGVVIPSPNPDFLHNWEDTISLAYVDGASAATDESSLYTLIYALVQAYNSHGADVDSEELNYHWEIVLEFIRSDYLWTEAADPEVEYTPPKGPFQTITLNEEPTTIEEAVDVLNELRMKWEWHRLGVFTHNELNTLDKINKYPVYSPPIGTVNENNEIVVTPNIDDFLRYANYLKHFYNMHMSNGQVGADWFSSTNDDIDAHRQYVFNSIDNATFDDLNIMCNLPDCRDLTSAYLLIYWVWSLYEVHLKEAQPGYPVEYDTTAGSPNLSNVAATNPFTGEPTSGVLIEGGFVYEPSTGFIARVEIASGTNATLSRSYGTTNTGVTAIFFGAFHAAVTTNPVTFGDTVTTGYGIPTNFLLPDEIVEPRLLSGIPSANRALPATTQAWIELADTIFNSMAVHTANRFVHTHYLLDEAGGYIKPSDILVGNGDFFKPTMDSYSYALVYLDEYNTPQEEIQVRSAVQFSAAIETSKIYPSGAVISTGLSQYPYHDPSDSEISGGFTENMPVVPLPSIGISEPAFITLENIPVLSNDLTTNYATSTIDIEIYRTTSNGNTYYLVDSIDNGTTEFIDDVSDSLGNSLDSRQLLYTTGGVVENDQPPFCKFIHIFQNSAYFGYVIEDSGSTFKSRIIQSVPDSPDSAPQTFSIELDDELTGISSTKNNLVGLCKNSCHRISGLFNLQGQGFLKSDKIGDVGCVSTASIVQTEIGVFFASNDGFYYTDAFQLIKISLDLDETYRTLVESETQASRIHGTYNRLKRTVEWTVQRNPTDFDCDKIYVFYLNYGIKPSGVFSTMSNGDHFHPSAITYFEDRLIRGDARGLIFKHDDIYLTDPKVPSDVTTSYSDWGFVYVPWHWKSTAMDFGTSSVGQWVTKIHLLGLNNGNANIQINSISDNRNSTDAGKRSLAPIQYTDNPVWGDPGINWGDEDYNWEYDGKLDFWRRFSTQTLRSQIKQIEFVPARVGVYNYDQFPEFSYATVNHTTNVATISQPTGYTDIVWPLDVVDMYISFEFDDYEAEFPITAVDEDEVTFTDADNDLTASLSNQKWVIRGYQKESGLSISGYVLTYASFGQRGKSYPGITGRGENG